VIHLKRLLPQHKITTLVDFPLRGFDPRPYLAKDVAGEEMATDNTTDTDIDADLDTATSSRQVPTV
jgi:hypothetical protein